MNDITLIAKGFRARLDNKSEDYLMDKKVSVAYFHFWLKGWKHADNMLTITT